MWFVYDPEDPEFEVYLTEEEAKAAFEAIIKRYRTEASLEYAWDEGIGGVCMGRVTHRVELRSVDTDPDDLAYLIECGVASEGDQFSEAFVIEVEVPDVVEGHCQ